MAAGTQAVPTIQIPVGGAGSAVMVPDAGSLAVVPPTFLEKWGVVFVSVAGAWMLIIAAALMVYYLTRLAATPAQASGLNAEDYTKLLTLHKTASDQLRESLNFIFELLVTKTVLPLVTLLLGYLFGSKKT